MLMEEINLILLKLFFRWQNNAPRKCWRTDSFDHSNTFRVPSTINEISDAEVNEVTQAHWSNTGNYYNKHGGKYGDKQHRYKGRRTSRRNHGKIRTKRHGTKTHKSQYGNKESKPKDACITVTKDVKYFCPTGFDKGIFNAVTKLLHEKVEQAKRSGSDNAKTVKAIECENFCNFFKISEQLYDAAFTQVIGESIPKILGKGTD